MSEQVQWCLCKLEDSLLDYNIEEAKHYLELAQQWLSKGE